MKNLTVAQVARDLGVSLHSVCAYLANGKLDGDALAGVVSAESLRAYRVRITPHYTEIAEILESDFSLTTRERDILERRARFEKLHEIGAAHDITKSRVSAIIRRLRARFATAEKGS